MKKLRRTSGVFFIESDPYLRAKSGQTWPKWAKMGQNGPNGAKMGPNWGQMGAKSGQNGGKWAPNRAKMGQILTFWAPWLINTHELDPGTWPYPPTSGVGLPIYTTAGDNAGA